MKARIVCVLAWLSALLGWAPLHALGAPQYAGGITYFSRTADLLARGYALAGGGPNDMQSLAIPGGAGSLMVGGPASYGAPGGPAFGMAQYSSILGTQGEAIWQPTYDRVNYAAAGVFQLFFFTVPFGSSATLIRAGAGGSFTKTFRDTNLTQQGLFATKAIDVRGLSVRLIPVQSANGAANTAAIGDDKQRLFNGGFLQLTIVDKPRFTLPLIELKNLDPDFAQTTVTASTQLTAASNGGGIYWFEQSPIVIPMNVNWGAMMQWDGSPPLVQTFDILLTLHGFQLRPAQ